jgi:hypothetical protein
MVVKVLNVLCHFLGFAFKPFFQEKTHNMFTLMLDVCFLFMDYIMHHIGKDVATKLVQQYDGLILLPLLNNILVFLNVGQTIIPILATLVILQVGCLGQWLHGIKLNVKFSLFHSFNVENAKGLNLLKL